MTQLSATENILSDTWLWLGLYQKSWSQRCHDAAENYQNHDFMISKDLIMEHSWELMKSWFSH